MIIHRTFKAEREIGLFLFSKRNAISIMFGCIAGIIEPIKMFNGYEFSLGKITSIQIEDTVDEYKKSK